MKKYILSAVLILIISSLSFAQYGSTGSVDARGMSMAKTYNAASNGVFAIGINPANLMFSEDKYFEFSTILPLPDLALTTGTNFISINDFNYFFGGVDGHARLLTDADKSRLNDLFKDGGEVFGSVSLNIFSAMYKYSPSVGAFGISVSDVGGGRFTMPKALVDLGLNGNKMNTTYNFDDAEMEIAYMRDYSLTYARALPELQDALFKDVLQNLSAGITFKMVQGFSYATLNKVNSTLTTGAGNEITGVSDLVVLTALSPDFHVKYDFDSTTSNQKNDNISPFPTPAGTGLGIDFGLAAQMDKWHFALSITDIGSMTWDKGTVKYTSSGDITISDLSDSKQFDTLQERIKSKGSYTGSFSTNLPTTLRAGASYIFDDENDGVPGVLLLAADYNQGFNTAPGNTTKPRLSVASEWAPSRGFILRTGLSFGGFDGFNWALGIGLNAGLVEFNFATTDMQSFVAPNTAKRISFSMGSRWKI